MNRESLITVNLHRGASLLSRIQFSMVEKQPLNCRLLSTDSYQDVLCNPDTVRNRAN